jgi:hypothetical protein
MRSSTHGLPPGSSGNGRTAACLFFHRLARGSEVGSLLSRRREELGRAATLMLKSISTCQRIRETLKHQFQLLLRGSSAGLM